MLDAANAYAASPLVGADVLVASTADGCNVTFFAHAGRVPSLVAWWSPCAPGAPPDPLLAGGALTDDGRELVLATARGAWGLSAGADDAGRQLWAAALPLAPAAPPLVQGCTAVFAPAAGNVTLLTRPAAGCGPRAPLVAQGDAPVLCSANDTVAAPPAALPGGGFLIVSAAGCATGFDAAARAVWTARLGGANGSVVAPPLVDAAAGQAYALADGGSVCCVSVAPADCAGWPARCVPLAGARPPLRGGLAASPPSADFHGGELYAADADGVLFVISAAGGAVGSSSGQFRAAAPVWAAPVLAVGAWGPGKHGLVLAAAGGRNASHGPCAAAAAGERAGERVSCVVALAVGSNGAGRDDDDARDDDGYGTIGRMWVAALAPGAEANASGVALHADGRVFVPTSRGVAVVSSRADAPAAGPNEALLEGLAFGAVGAGVAALAVVLWCVARQRKRRAARLREGLEAEEEEGGGGGSSAYMSLGAADEGDFGGAGGGAGAVPAAPAPGRAYTLNGLVN